MLDPMDPMIPMGKLYGPSSEELKQWVVERDKHMLSNSMIVAKDSPEALWRMVAMRLHLEGHEALGFTDFHPVRRGDDVFAFVVPYSGDPVVIQDKWELFPSDAFITKIRLLRNNK